MHAQINPPSEHGRNLALIAECRFALEPSMLRLLDAAEDAGWDRSTVVTALATFLAEIPEGKSPSRYPVS
jgi:hypothetical protein